MKVIGIVPGTYTTKAAKLIVEMTPEELNHIQGEWVKEKEPVVGMKVEVDEIFKRLRELKENQYQLSKVRAQLRAVADLLEPLEGVVSCDSPAEENGDAEQSSQS
jgi:hypothetical protein